MSNTRLFPGLRGRFGDWAYYSVLMSVRDIVDRIKYAREIHKSNSLSDLIQRELDDGERAIEIRDYLKANPDRFFNSLVVAIYGGDPGWRRVEVSATTLDSFQDSLDISASESFGFLELTGDEKLFALDGQHRLAGLKLSASQNEEFSSEELSVILVAHKNDETGIRRTRKLFTTLNKTAKPVKKSEIIALDECDAMAIVTRHFVENTSQFADNRVDFRKTPNLPRTDRTHLTTIVNLYDTLSILLKGFYALEHGQTKDVFFQLRTYRPDDKSLEKYKDFSLNFFLNLAQVVPPLDEYFSKADPHEVISKYRKVEGGHVLFRPVGLKIFAGVFTHLRKSQGEKESFKILSSLPTDLEQPPYKNTIWNVANGRVENRHESLCRDVLLYMAGQVGATEKLKVRYSKALGDSDADLPSPLKRRR